MRDPQRELGRAGPVGGARGSACCCRACRPRRVSNAGLRSPGRSVGKKCSKRRGSPWDQFWVWFLLLLCIFFLLGLYLSAWKHAALAGKERVRLADPSKLQPDAAPACHRRRWGDGLGSEEPFGPATSLQTDPVGGREGKPSSTAPKARKNSGVRR